MVWSFSYCPDREPRYDRIYPRTAVLLCLPGLRPPLSAGHQARFVLPEMQVIPGGRRPIHVQIAALDRRDLVHAGAMQSKIEQAVRVITLMLKDDDVITFQLPHPESTRTLSITLRSWSEGLQPWNSEEYLSTAGVCVRDHFNYLWSYSLQDIRKQVDPVEWHLWIADVPDEFLRLLRHHGLDQLGALYLLRRFPDMRQALAVGPFFQALVRCWVADITYTDVAFADERLQRKLALRRHEALRLTFDNEELRKPISPLRIRFLSLLPATFRIRGNHVGLVAYQDYDAFLPEFLNSRRRFKEKLDLLRAFEWACLSASVPFEDALPLFGKTLRRPVRARTSNLAKLFSRLATINRRLGKPGIGGLLRGAPSIRFLEKYLRRQEKRFHERRMLGLLPAEPNEFPKADLPETPFLEPLLNVTALRQEGAYMGNCIANYEQELRRGDHAAYRMRWPQRGTVLLQSGLDGKWFIEDAREEHDAEMSDSGLDVLTAWLTGQPLMSIPENLPAYYPEAFLDEGHYAGIDAFEALGDHHLLDDLADDDGECTTSKPVPVPIPFLDCDERTVLPELLNGWMKFNCPEQLKMAGFDADMINSEYSKAILDSSRATFLHPKFTLGFVIVHAPRDPANSMEIVKHRYGRWQKISFKDVQLTGGLRQALMAWRSTISY